MLFCAQHFRKLSYQNISLLELASTLRVQWFHFNIRELPFNNKGSNILHTKITKTLKSKKLLKFIQIETYKLRIQIIQHLY